MFGKTFKKTVMAGAAASVMVLGLAGTASAGTITVGGVTWDPDAGSDFTSNSALVEKIVGVGDYLSGFGLVTTMNGTATFCLASGCELTFEFGGFKLEKATVDGDDTTVVFSGGWINFYVDFTPDFNADLLATALGDNLWLTLLGHEDLRDGMLGTLFGLLTGGLNTPNGDGDGLLDVGVAGGGACTSTDTTTGVHLPLGCNPEDGNSGLANANFDTDGRPDNNIDQKFADFFFTSSFQPGSGNTNFPLFGSGDLQGNSIGIPEPTSLALFGFSLLGLGLVGRRRRRTA